MANRLMQLEEEIVAAPEQEDDAATEDGGYSEPSVRAQSLARARPISYRVPGSVPVITQPSSLNAWAAMTAMLLSWREHHSMSIDDALGTIGREWVDRFHRNEGVLSEDKAPLLAAAGLKSNPPMKLDAEDWERLLRENGPLWVTDDERAGKLFSPRAYLLVGISGTGRSTRVDVIDPAKGIQVRERLNEFVRRFVHPGAPRAYPRLQVLHLQQPAPTPSTNGSAAPRTDLVSAPQPMPPAPPAQLQPTSQGIALQQQAAAGPIIAGAALTYTIIKDALTSEGDIHYQLEQMNGLKHPFDDVSYGNRAQFASKDTESEAWVTNGFGIRVAHAAFNVKFRYNGYSVGDVNLTRVRATDQPGWGAEINATILPAREAYRIGGQQPVAAVEVTFEYSFNRSIGQDIIFIDRIVCFGDGSVSKQGRWTQT